MIYNKMSYHDLIQTIIKNTGVEEGDVRRVLDVLFETISSLDMIHIPHFGVFQSIEKKVNKKNGEKKVIKTVKFTPSYSLKKEIRKEV